MPLKHPALALIAGIIVLTVPACRSTPPPANNGTPAEVFSLSTVGVSGDSPIATLSDAESTASVGTPSADQSRAICQPTPADDEGSDYLEGAPSRNNLAPTNAAGDSLTLSGFVYIVSDSSCTPLANAVIDIWHADSSGVYDTSSDFLYRGKVETDAQGHYTVTTIVPGASGDATPTIHVGITHPDAVLLTTRLFFEAGSDPARTLILAETDSGYTTTYDFVLSAD